MPVNDSLPYALFISNAVTATLKSPPDSEMNPAVIPEIITVNADFMSVSSYGDGTKSSGVVKIAKDLDETLEGKNVLIVEDIIDSGRTLYYLMDILAKRNPKSMKLCTLLDKPERRVKDVKVDYVGFNIPDEFVVGYGLDYAQRYRNLPFIGVVEGVE